LYKLNPNRDFSSSSQAGNGVYRAFEFDIQFIFDYETVNFKQKLDTCIQTINRLNQSNPTTKVCVLLGVVFTISEHQMIVVFLPRPKRRKNADRK
jgi:hypothetical protein